MQSSLCMSENYHGPAKIDSLEAHSNQVQTLQFVLERAFIEKQGIKIWNSSLFFWSSFTTQCSAIYYSIYSREVHVPESRKGGPESFEWVPLHCLIPSRPTSESRKNRMPRQEVIWSHWRDLESLRTVSTVQCEGLSCRKCFKVLTTIHKE